MKVTFTQEILDGLKEKIIVSLKETLHVMFGVEVSLTSAPLSSMGDKVFESHVDLENGVIRTCLSVVLPYEVAEQIVRSLGGSLVSYTRKMMQDATNEVTNVVVHAIRTYFIESHDMALNVNIPIPGSPRLSSAEVETVNLYFMIKESKTINVGFSY